MLSRRKSNPILGLRKCTRRRVLIVHLHHVRSSSIVRNLDIGVYRPNRSQLKGHDYGKLRRTHIINRTFEAIDRYGNTAQRRWESLSPKCRLSHIGKTGAIQRNQLTQSKTGCDWLVTCRIHHRDRIQKGARSGERGSMQAHHQCKSSLISDAHIRRASHSEAVDVANEVACCGCTIRVQNEVVGRTKVKRWPHGVGPLVRNSITIAISRKAERSIVRSCPEDVY